ncbi:2-hydroxycarboxylate transporter family protein [Gilliamella sp. B14384H2]|uniref:2-hydroxycarboxylate transporter family protein n=1 Tax=unclassified Gilliamella TaxID=2685620 RepID=UPI0018DC3140|nr:MULTISPECIES: 2-hydroxycarboxylate transporter family protein [unclassified Gilliamella]MBI0037264.1 2-hydroxycarboxylate transporter family protein [Gilliamella sp. B14384G10]MBI0039083.1 2-hydroxycarboxylate transporter family protein [Gilliamella sp. B14384G7]MBI0051258.1 2-hydroxycarboxylate transporter family protein [Gilliamella sp. B14384G13]MBI0053551.1 2-hydroxycarboxylate transporter family protein [Gilliamella sp. B14384H2]
MSILQDIKENKIYIGSLPLPIFLVCSIIVIIAAQLDMLPRTLIGGFAVILPLGWFLGTVGQNIPFFKKFGAPAILSLIVPSLLVYYGVFDENTLSATKMLMKESNFLLFYIASLVCGSILGMHRVILVQGFIRMMIPMLLGMCLAALVGVTVAVAFGDTWEHAFFYTVSPVMAGGIGEGVLQLSNAYSNILNQDYDSFVSALIPATVVGNFFAITFTAIMSRIGEVKPHLSGHGQLVKIEFDGLAEALKDDKTPLDARSMSGAVMILATLFIFGMILEKMIHFPGPVLMIIATAVVKYFRLLPESVERGSQQWYKFISGNFTFPLMAGLGLLYIDLASVVNVLTIPYFITIIAIVFTVSMTGFVCSFFLKMYPVEASIISSCQSGMGGTGDVAILSTANRMNLMPFAQVATRLGGALMVICTTALMRYLHM